MMHRTRQFVVIAMLIAGSAVAATIEVAPGSSIQQAVAAAAPGDTVSVAPGTYREQIQLKDGVTIVGADRATVIVEWPGDKGSTLIIRDCPGGAVRRVTFRHVPLAESEQPKDGFDVVWISDSSAEVSDCVISGGTANGLQIRGKGAPVIANCVIEKNRQYGIALVGIVTTPAITGNRIAANSGSGLGVFEAVPRSHAKIEDNVITDNSGYGIWMDGKSWVDVKGNDFTKNGQICKFEIETLFQAKKFDMLETIAARLRRDKARYPAGGWQLQWFYDFLSARAWTMGPEDMAREEQTIAEWQKAHPGSITWRVVLVNNYIRQAWKSRGGGYAREVTPEAWAGYREGMRKAWAVMDEAAAIEPKDAEYYVMLCVLSMESPRDTVSPGLWSFLSDAVSTLLGAGAKDAAARAFDEGVKHEPLYLRFYEERSRQLLPRWHGSVSQMMAFADRSAADIGGADGDAMYAVIASAVLKSESDETFLGSYSFSWEQIQRGYDALLKQFPASNYFRNQCLRMAGVYRDAGAAARLIKEGCTFDAHVWKNENAFNAIKAWGLGAALPEPTPLEIAVNEIDTDKVRSLLESGADPKALSSEGSTLLEAAVLNDDFGTAQALVSGGADINARGGEGDPLIKLALNELRPDSLNFFISNKADLNAADARGWPPVCLAIAWGRPLLARVLLDAGADPNVPCVQTPLQLAIKQSSAELVPALIERGADPNCAYHNQKPPITLATMNQDIAVCRYLLEHGADPNAALRDGWTALFEAADQGNLAIAQLLVEHGADVNKRQTDGWTTFHMAAMAGHQDVLEFLLSKSPEGLHALTDTKYTLLHTAAKNGRTDLAKWLIAKGLDINARESGGKTPLGLALDRKHEDTAQALRAAGAAE